MSLSTRLDRLEQVAQAEAEKALAYVARVYGCTSADLDWLCETKRAIEAGIEGVWWEIVNDAIYRDGIEMYEAEPGGSLIAREIETP